MTDQKINDPWLRDMLRDIPELDFKIYTDIGQYDPVRTAVAKYQKAVELGLRAATDLFEEVLKELGDRLLDETPKDVDRWIFEKVGAHLATYRIRWRKITGMEP